RTWRRGARIRRRPSLCEFRAADSLSDPGRRSRLSGHARTPGPDRAVTPPYRSGTRSAGPVVVPARTGMRRRGARGPGAPELAGVVGMKIGFIGLGRMGAGMASRLLAGGHSLVV